MQTKHKRKKASHAKEEAQKILVFKIKLALIKKKQGLNILFKHCNIYGIKKGGRKTYIYIRKTALKKNNLVFFSTFVTDG